MNVGLITVWGERGAGYVSRAYREVLRTRHRVFIYARGGNCGVGGEPEWDDLDVHWAAPCPGMPDGYIDFDVLRKWVRQKKIDCLFFNEQQCWETVVRARCLGMPVGCYVDYYTAETVPFFSLYDFLVCNTERHASVFKTHPACWMVPWGTDVERFTPDGSPRRRRGITFFHSCGMSAYRKGTDLLAEAFSLVSGDARLVVHAQGVLRDSFLWCGDRGLVDRTCSLLESDSRVEVVSRCVGGAGLYSRGDVYVYPSRLDGIGLTVPEALASGLPAIVTDEPPMNEFVDPTRGRLVPVGSRKPRADGYYWEESTCDVSALAQAMQYYVDHPRQVPEHATAARAYAVSSRDWEKNAQALPGCFEKAVVQQPPQLGRLGRDAIRYDRRGRRYPNLSGQMELRLRRLRTVPLIADVLTSLRGRGGGGAAAS